MIYSSFFIMPWTKSPSILKPFFLFLNLVRSVWLISFQANLSLKFSNTLQERSSCVRIVLLLFFHVAILIDITISQNFLLILSRILEIGIWIVLIFNDIVWKYIIKKVNVTMFFRGDKIINFNSLFMRIIHIGIKFIQHREFSI